MWWPQILRAFIAHTERLYMQTVYLRLILRFLFLAVFSHVSCKYAQDDIFFHEKKSVYIWLLCNTVSLRY